MRKGPVWHYVCVCVCERTRVIQGQEWNGTGPSNGLHKGRRVKVDGTFSVGDTVTLK